MAIQLDQVNLVVSDMAASVAFYRCLGVKVGETDADFQDHHRSAERDGPVDLDIDSQQFAAKWDRGWAGSKVVLGFKVDSREGVDEVFGRIVKAGYHTEQEPYDAFWGARYAVVRDPDGNSVGIMSPIDPGRRSRAPDPGEP